MTNSQIKKIVFSGTKEELMALDKSLIPQKYLRTYYKRLNG